MIRQAEGGGATTETLIGMRIDLMRSFRMVDVCGRRFEIVTAKSAWQRYVGLLGRWGLGADSGLLLPNCNRIHTFGMLFSIDVVFLDGRYRIVAAETAVRPWRLLACCSAQHTLELAAGSVGLLARRNRLLAGRPKSVRAELPRGHGGDLARLTDENLFARMQPNVEGTTDS